MRLNFVTITFLVSLLISCADELSTFESYQGYIFNRELASRKGSEGYNKKVDSIIKKTDDLLYRRRDEVYLFDFGSNQSPYIEGSIVVTPSNRSLYHRWINNFGVVDADQKLINPIFTDFLAGEGNNEILLNIPEGVYEITFIVGSERMDVNPFKININGNEYLIVNKRFKEFASKAGYYAFNSIINGIKTESSIIKLKFIDKWLVNAIILSKVRNFELKSYSHLPSRSYTPDYYYLLSRENAIKWSSKFGYNYEMNWDYLINTSEQILSSNGLSDADPVEKIKFIADYVDRTTRETCCTVPEIDILNSPVDIIDPEGYKKGSCFGLARLVGVLANSYGLPARLVMYFIDSDFAPFPSLFPQIASPLFLVRGNLPYSSFGIGGYNHTEVEVFYEGRWHLFTNYQFEEHITHYSAIEVVNDRSIPSFKRYFYDNVQDVMYVNLFIANTNRADDYCELPYSRAFYDLDTAQAIYPENEKWTFKTDNHLTALNSLRIGRYWSLRGTLELQYNWVKRIGRELFVPELEDNEKLILNIMLSGSNRDIEENLNLYVNDIKVDYQPFDKLVNQNFAERSGGVYQFRVQIDKDRVIQGRLNSFDIELKDSDAKIKVIIGKNDNRISNYDTFTMDYCNQWDMMRSSNSYYYSGSNRYLLYNNPVMFLEVIK